MLAVSCLKTCERFMSIGQTPTFPLFFASNALYSVAMMPKALQVFAQVNPMSYVVDAVRSFPRLGIDLWMFGLASANFRRIIE